MKKINTLSALFVGLLLSSATVVVAQEEDLPFEDDLPQAEMSANDAFNLLVSLRIEKACDAKCYLAAEDTEKMLVKYGACTKRVGLSKEILGIAQKLQKRGYLESGVRADLKATVEEYNTACEGRLTEEAPEEGDDSGEFEDEFPE
jgi:hypothetical protein